MLHETWLRPRYHPVYPLLGIPWSLKLHHNRLPLYKLLKKTEKMICKGTGDYDYLPILLGNSIIHIICGSHNDNLGRHRPRTCLKFCKYLFNRVAQFFGNFENPILPSFIAFGYGQKLRKKIIFKNWATLIPVPCSMRWRSHVFPLPGAEKRAVRGRPLLKLTFGGHLVGTGCKIVIFDWNILKEFR